LQAKTFEQTTPDSNSPAKSSFLHAMYHLKNEPREKRMSVDDREGHAAEHHGTAEANYDTASRNVAKEIATGRAANHIEYVLHGGFPQTTSGTAACSSPQP
jgi:hypothetical protein